MRKSRSIRSYLTSQETISGAVYFAFQIFLLSGLLQWFNGKLSHPLNTAELNFVYYLINFMAMLLIYHDFLGSSARQVGQHPAYFCQAVILGFVAYYACSWCLNHLFEWIAPGYTNANDASIAALSRGNFFLMAIGTIVLVPPVEECFYRGLIFRNLYSVSRLGAYIVSMAAFSFIHIIGYIHSYTPWQLILCFLQYMPAGLCLAWSYTKSDTIFAPIVIHALVNATAIGFLR